MFEKFTNYIGNVDSLISIIAIVCSVIALWQTHRQIKLSNRQHLFDRRLSGYLIVTDLIQSYQIQQKDCRLKDDDGFVSSIGLAWLHLTGNLYLESIQNACDYPIESQEGKNFSVKLAEFHRLAQEIQFLFSENISIPVSLFIQAYIQVLQAIYQYRLVWNFAQQEPSIKCLPLKQKFEEVGMPNYQKKVFDALDKLESTYQTISKQGLVLKMKESIKL